MSGSGRATPGQEEHKHWLTPGVAGVGATSFFSDAGHEMVTSILPGFLSALGGSAAVLGIIEGLSDALTGVTKVAGGPLADHADRRRRIAGSGYVLTALATGAIGLTVATWQVGILRAVAWAARGFRTPARDSLLASLSDRRSHGRAFGVERAGDNLGAVVGPLLAGLLTILVGTRTTMIIATVPGLLAAVSIGIAAREARRRRQVSEEGSSLTLSLLARYSQLRHTELLPRLLPIVCFEGGNLAATLLILRGTGLLSGIGAPRVAAAVVTALYAAHNLAAALAALVGGRLVDRRGGGLVLGVAAGIYVLSYLGFAVGPRSWAAAGILFVLSGVAIGFAETAESAIVSTSLPDELRGTGFGALGLVQAAGDLVATLVAGILYAAVSPAAAFGYAAVWMLLAAVMTVVVRRRQRRTPTTH